MLLITSWREREEPGCLRLNRLGRIQASTPFPIRTSGTHAQTPFICTATHRDLPLRQPAAPRHGADGSLMWLELCGWNYLWLDPCFYREPLGIASFFLSTTAFFYRHQTENQRAWTSKDDPLSIYDLLSLCPWTPTLFLSGVRCRVHMSLAQC